MALSDYERRMLEELEAQLTDDDPKFAEALAPEDGGDTRLAISPRHLVFGLIGAVVGLLVVVAGIATELIIIGVAGVIMVFLGLWYVVGGTKQVPVAAGSKPTRPQAGGPGFMEKQAQEWMRRREGGK